jgi:hypothetical protein
LSVDSDGDRLIVSPSSELTDDDRQFIRFAQGRNHRRASTSPPAR